MNKLKKIAVIAILAAGSAASVNSMLPNATAIVQAAQTTQTPAKWGAVKLYTTPKAVRGTWYYRDYKNKLQKLKITAHTINGVKIYQDLSEKQFTKYSKKIQKMSLTKSDQLYDWFTKHIKAGETVKRKGVTGMDINEWLVEAGSGAEFLPATRVKQGKKVKALKIDTGAFIPEGYAYQNKKYARRIDV